MKKSGGISIGPEAVTVIFDDYGVDVEKIVDGQGEVLYEADDGGGED